MLGKAVEFPDPSLSPPILRLPLPGSLQLLSRNENRSLHLESSPSNAARADNRGAMEDLAPFIPHNDFDAGLAKKDRRGDLCGYPFLRSSLCHNDVLTFFLGPHLPSLTPVRTPP